MLMRTHGMLTKIIKLPTTVPRIIEECRFATVADSQGATSTCPNPNKLLSVTPLTHKMTSAELKPSHFQQEKPYSTFSNPIIPASDIANNNYKATPEFRPQQRNVQQLVSSAQKLQKSQESLPAELDYGEKLCLTPYIKAGRISEAQKLAKVDNLNNPICDRKIKEFGYSGYLTVNEKFNSNLFFWFFPAQVNPEKAPVLLWINGGPGASSMFGLFAGHGPFFVDTIGEIQPRKISWAINHSVVYIDSPVGTGFSFTENEEGYCRTLDEVMRDLYEGLHQFFTLFPEYQSKDFYITGQSYTGKYAPALAHKIHHENLKASEKNQLKLNLKGIAVGSGLCDPVTQTDYGDFLFNIGLIDMDQKSHFDEAYKQVCKLIAQKNWSEAHTILQHLIIGWPRPIVAHFEMVTGYTFHSNYLYQDMPARYGYYMQFLRNDFVRRGIHVGNQPFGEKKNQVYNYLADDFPQSVKHLVEELLDLNYKIMFYASQFDIIVPHTGIDRFIRSLNWAGIDKYKSTSRKIWLVDNEVAGYVKETDNLVHVLCRNAGHLAMHDQPQACFDMISRFTRSISF